MQIYAKATYCTKKLGCRDVPHDSPKNNIWSNFFCLKTDSKITLPNKSYKRRDFKACEVA